MTSCAYNCESLNSSSIFLFQAPVFSRNVFILSIAVASFTKNRKDLKDVYLTFVRSMLEQSAVVWHSSLTSKNRIDLERVQKAAVRVIMGNAYTTYRQSLKELGMDTLERRREILCLRFAKKCLKNEKFKIFFL